MTIPTATAADIRLVSNADDTSHLRILKNIIESALGVTICVAYFRMSGYAPMSAMLKKLANSEADLSIFIGTDQYITEPDALKALHRLVESNGRARVFLVRGNASVFHPKLYFARRARYAEALIGSANITGGGLMKNIEASIHAVVPIDSPFCREIEAFLDLLEASGNTEPLDHINIAQYEARYDIYRKHKRRAERGAKEEISSLFEINENKLKRYLKEYLADRDETANRQQRILDYRKAKIVLNEIADLRSPSEKQFMRLYEQLVGSKDSDRLWHSGSVFRLKNKVAPHGQRVATLVRTLRDRLSNTPSDIYSVALKKSSLIPGVGPNIITEILNTYTPKKFAVLNRNPLDSLRELGFKKYPGAQSFTPEKYADYCGLLKGIGEACGLNSLGEVDHFLNYIYWKYVKNA